MNAMDHDQKLSELSDPDFIALWAKLRNEMILGNGDKDRYRAVAEEYERRTRRRES
jgi:hypothetical protein